MHHREDLEVVGLEKLLVNSCHRFGGEGAGRRVISAERLAIPPQQATASLRHVPDANGEPESARRTLQPYGQSEDLHVLAGLLEALSMLPVGSDDAQLLSAHRAAQPASQRLPDDAPGPLVVVGMDGPRHRSATYYREFIGAKA